MALLALMKIFKYNGVTVKQLAQENVLSRKSLFRIFTKEKKGSKKKKKEKR